MQFTTTHGLYLLSFLMPLILLYLIKAKPKEITIPSLIFFTEEKQTKKYNSILRKLLIRTLFFLQFLFIAAIALSAANPVITIPVDAYSSSTVVIMDTSASMKTLENGATRFNAGKPELLKLIKGRSSIILAEENPIVLATNISASRARALITNLEPKDTVTRIDSAILLANEMLGAERGTIIIYSDFLVSKDDDLLAAKKIAEANDKRVTFVQIGKKQTNTGFINLNLNKDTGEAFIKNYADKTKVVDVKLIQNNNQRESQRIEIMPLSTERITFDLLQGETTLQLSEKDNLPVDDKITIMNPYNTKSTILFITNKKDNNPLLDALQANPRLNIEITIPPVVPDLTHDLVIVSDINKNMLLPNTFRDIKKYKESGGKVILTAQDSMDQLDFQGLISFSIASLKTEENEICIDRTTQFTILLSDQKCFTTTKKHFELNKLSNSSIVIASTKSKKPLFILENNLFYYGIIDTASEFRNQINYPLFWSSLIDSMLGKEDLSQFNYRTGDLLIGFSNDSTKTALQTVGVIDLQSKKAAVNLLNDEESNIYRDSAIFNKAEFEDKYEKVNMELNLDQYILLFAILLFCVELFYIKRRGDL